MRFILNLLKVDRLAQKMKGVELRGNTHTQNGDTAPIFFGKKRKLTCIKEGNVL
jgi:hypothetical protein